MKLAWTVSLCLFIAFPLYGCSGSGSSSSTPSASATNAPSGFKTLPEHWSGANLNALVWEGGGWSNDQAYAAARAFGPSLIRYPGGTVTDYFDWRSGGAVDRCRFRTPSVGGCRDWDTTNLPELSPFNAFTGYTGGTLPNLKTLAVGAGAQVLFTLNLVTDSYQGNLDMLESAEALGMPVNYIQLGNEHYFANDNYVALFPDGASYGALARDWITRLKARFPAAKFVVTGYVPEFDLSTGKYSHADDADYIKRATVWNEQMVRSGVLDVADAVSLHVYARPVGDLAGNGFNPAVVSRVLSHAHDYLELYFKRPEYLALPANTRIWFTEYNINGSLAPGIYRSWVHGLYIGLFTAKLLTHPDVDRLVTHMLMGSGLWQNVFHPGDFAGVNAVPGSTPYSLTATGNVLQKFFHRSPSLNLVKLVQAADVRASAADERLITGVLFSDRDSEQQALVFINASSQTVTINPNLIANSWSAAETMHAQPEQQILRPESLIAQNVEITDAVVLPAYSVTLFK